MSNFDRDFEAPSANAPAKAAATASRTTAAAAASKEAFPNASESPCSGSKGLNGPATSQGAGIVSTV